jgi:hypothetical protein
MICYNVLYCSQKAASALVIECYVDCREERANYFDDFIVTKNARSSVEDMFALGVKSISNELRCSFKPNSSC